MKIIGSTRCTCRQSHNLVRVPNMAHFAIVKHSSLSLPLPVNSLIQWPSLSATAALTVTHLAARGFGKPKPKPVDPAEDSSEQFSSSGRRAKKLRGKIIPCKPCDGTGLKRCQFCEGTLLMKGFLGNQVPCVPCQGKGTLGRPCPECKGVGFFTP